jgi:dynein heavy chain, axonemal
MFCSGIDGQNITLVLTDTQIVKETFLEDINNLLNTGDVPNLFLPEDYDKIINSVRPIVIQMKRIETQDNILMTFNERVREKFHITLCMSPVGDSLRVRCRMFPSLVNCCTLNWFDRWPEQALLYVSSEFLKEVDLPNEDIRMNLAQMCMMIHTTVEEKSAEFYEKLRRKVYTTPKSYLDLIHLYVSSLELKREEQMKNKRRLALGLKKL